MQTASILPILTASLASFMIGAIWYSPYLFGKEWISLIHMSPEKLNEIEREGLWKFYGTHLLGTLISFSVLAFFIISFGAKTWIDGSFLGFLTWLGFNATEALGSLIWEKRPLKLVLINSINTLVSLVVGGAIIGGWL